MRTLYLIRHCEPDFTKIRKDDVSNATVCLGTGDPPLSFIGRMRAVLIGEWIRNRQVTAVFCSTKKRSRETAAAIAGNAIAEADFREINMGVWEGLTFSEIRERYPDLYETRGKKPFTVYPEGGEKPADALIRFSDALLRILSETRGDIAVVAHGGVNRLFLAKVLGYDMEHYRDVTQSYGCVNTIEGDSGTLRVKAVDEKALPPLTDALCERLLKAAETPDAVRAHARAVAFRSDEIADSLLARGIAIDRSALHAAALLHDMLRTKTNHAEAASDLIRTLGYPDVADIVATHHELPEEAMKEPNARAVLYLADKQTLGTEYVSVGTRFAKSLAKCDTEEARVAHAARYEQVKRVERLIGEV